MGLGDQLTVASDVGFEVDGLGGGVAHSLLTRLCCLLSSHRAACLLCHQ